MRGWKAVTPIRWERRPVARRKRGVSLAIRKSMHRNVVVQL